ncbi:hypothetical protein GO491_11685 [Flavobacteriaceae bacterium Ap0902]|nr:hypothetical protein [Flavobacteriaceae bacterium Ap0902]
MLINNKNHKNLKSNVPFEKLPEWFQDARTSNAKVYYKRGLLIWYRGTWIGGVWEYGIWKEGTWLGGTWVNGFKKIKSKCKHQILYSPTTNELRIGCIRKTIEEWDKWFEGRAEYETSRGTREFKKIIKAFENAKKIIQNDN